MLSLPLSDVDHALLTSKQDYHVTFRTSYSEEMILCAFQLQEAGILFIVLLLFSSFFLRLPLLLRFRLRLLWLAPLHFLNSHYSLVVCLPPSLHKINLHHLWSTLSVKVGTIQKRLARPLRKNGSTAVPSC